MFRAFVFHVVFGKHTSSACVPIQTASSPCGGRPNLLGSCASVAVCNLFVMGVRPIGIPDAGV